MLGISLTALSIVLIPFGRALINVGRKQKETEVFMGEMKSFRENCGVKWDKMDKILEAQRATCTNHQMGTASVNQELRMVIKELEATRAALDALKTAFYGYLISGKLPKGE